MFKPKRASIPRLLSRQITAGNKLGTTGVKAGTAIWAGGSALLLQQAHTASQSNLLPGIGLIGAMGGRALMKASSKMETELKEKNLLKLIGKRRLAFEVSQKTNDPQMRLFTLLIASAKTQSEREILKRIISGERTTALAPELTILARRVIKLENSQLTKGFHKEIRSIRGIPLKKLDFLAKKIIAELQGNKFKTQQDFQQRVQEYINPYALSTTMDRFEITNPSFGKSFLKLQKAQFIRTIQRTTIANQRTLNELAQDPILRQIKEDITQLTIDQLGSEKRAKEFLDHHSKVTTQLVRYIEEEVHVATRVETAKRIILDLRLLKL
ncbi:MAG: hypothetical protein WCW44_03910 [archaeon]|jgi:hypothetical protein